METTFSLNAKDICNIIKQCSQSGVKEFNFQGMHLTFHAQAPESVDSRAQASNHEDMVTEPLDQVQLMDQSAIDEVEEAQLLIDDPLALEKSQISRHLERSRQQR